MNKLIALLTKEIGYTEKPDGYTKFGDWYNNVEQDADYSTQPWCDMFLSWGAKKLGYESWFGTFAYTVDHARWFQAQDAWGYTPKPGAVVFFDWGGSDSIDAIDHVGIVTAVHGNRITTIEGNVDGYYVKEKNRGPETIVGYGYPDKIKQRQEAESAPARDRTERNKEHGSKPEQRPQDQRPQDQQGEFPGYDTTDPEILIEDDPGPDFPQPDEPPPPDETASSTPHPRKTEHSTTPEQSKTPEQGKTSEQGKTKEQPAKPSHKAQQPAPKHQPKQAPKKDEGLLSQLTSIPVAAIQELPAGGLGASALLAPVLVAIVAISYTKTRARRLRLAGASATRPAPRTRSRARAAARPANDPKHRRTDSTPTPPPPPPVRRTSEPTAVYYLPPDPAGPRHAGPSADSAPHPSPGYQGRRRKHQDHDLYQSGGLADALEKSWTAARQAETQPFPAQDPEETQQFHWFRTTD